MTNLNGLNIQRQCQKNLSQLNRVLYLCRKKLTNESLKTIYYSLAYSHIAYCVAIWSGTWTRHLNSVIIAQKHTIRTIMCTPRDPRSIPLFIENQKLSFKFIFKYFSAIVAFKYWNFDYCSVIFTKAQNQWNLRNNMNKSAVPFFRSTRGQKSIFYLTPFTWNSLPSELRQLSNVHSFKYQLKNVGPIWKISNLIQ